MSLKSGYPGSWVEVILSHQELAEMLRSQAATANQDAASGGARCSAADWPRPANQRPARISARQPQPLGLGLGVHSLIWLQHHTRGTAHCGDEELGTCLSIRINFYTYTITLVYSFHHRSSFWCIETGQTNKIFQTLCIKGLCHV